MTAAMSSRGPQSWQHGVCTMARMESGPAAQRRLAITALIASRPSVRRKDAPPEGMERWTAAGGIVATCSRRDQEGRLATIMTAAMSSRGPQSWQHGVCTMARMESGPAAQRRLAITALIASRPSVRRKDAPPEGM